MGSLGAVRNLSPAVVEHVLPLLPPAPTDLSFSRSRVNDGMAAMKAGKDKAMELYYPHLKTDVLTHEERATTRDGASIAMRVYVPNRTAPAETTRPLVYSLHGGGFISGDIDSEDLINRQLCYAVDTVVMSLDYRLAPEHPVVPTILNDAEDGLSRAFEIASKYEADISKGVLLSGTSVGGAMATTLGYRASRSLSVPIRGILCRQAVFIFAEYEDVAKPQWLPTLKSRVENADAPIMSRKTLNWINHVCAIPKKHLQDPNNFPMFAEIEELSTMPPVYLVGAGCCPCADEVKLFGEMLKQAGVAVKCRDYDTMPHGFHAFHILPEARQEMQETADGLRWLISVSS